MNFNQARALLVNYLRANIPTVLWGHPGIGKSALGQLVADEFELMFLDIRLGQHEPVDLNGYPHKDEASRTFDYFPWARFPLEDTELPINPKTNFPYKGWLIMFDEINTAPRQNLAAAYKIFLDRVVGQAKLHAKCRLMLGGNLVGEGLAGALPSPLVSRIAHITMSPELTSDLQKILGDSLFSFLTNHPKFCYQEPQQANTPYPTFRTWRMAYDYLQTNKDLTLEGLVGIVGTAAAVSYISFSQTEKELLEFIKGVEAFPLEKAQDLLEYLATDVTQLDKHMHRFPGEWKTLAEVRSKNIKEGVPADGG